MPRPETQSDVAKLYTLVLLVTAVAILYFAAAVLIPMALATLLAFILAPSVDRLERLRVPRIPAVLAVVGAVFVLIIGVSWVVANQMSALADDLPRYESNLVGRIEEVKRQQSSAFSRVEGVFRRIDREIREADKKAKEAKESSQEASPEGEEVAPVPVEIVDTTPAGVGILEDILPEAFGILGTLGVVIVFLIFMLLSRDDLRNRLIRLIGPDQITTTTQALDDAARRVSRYLRAQLIINFSYGVLMAMGLYLVGVPNAALLGLLGGLLRYVPYVGPWLGAGLGILLSVAESPAGVWTQPLIVLGLYLAAELLVNNVMEPMMYHSSTGVSTVGVIVAAVFWTWLWGAVGLVLSMPLTVCIVVMGRYVPQLEFLHVMLSDTEVLAPGPHLYQRLLVSDEEESRGIIEDYLEEHSIDELHENVILPVLELVESDSHRGTLTDERRLYVLESIQELLDELPALVPGATPKVAEDGQPSAPAAGENAVVIVPSRDLADEIAGDLLATRLERAGASVTVLSTKMLLSEVVEQINQLGAPLVIISAVPPYAVRHARNLTKRLRHRLDGTPLVVGLWSSDEPSRRTDVRLNSAGSDRVVHRFGQAVETAQHHLPRVRPPQPAAEVAAKPARD